MAITTNTVEPTSRNVDVANQEWQQGHIIGDGTARIFTGAGTLGRVQVNVAGTTVAFHDADADDTLDATNRVLLLDTASLGTKSTLEVEVRKGLAVVTVGAGSDITYQLRGAPTTNPEAFGV